ncbi:MAG TPA: cysteine-rich CWC family protein [Burkholderiaceae bacterium]
MSICSQCRGEFSCAMDPPQGDTPCWCTALPKLAIAQMPFSKGASSNATCLCPACLKKWLSDSQMNDGAPLV